MLDFCLLSHDACAQLRNNLQSTVGDTLALPSTLVFDHPTARLLVRGVSFSAAETLELISVPQHDHSPSFSPSLAAFVSVLPGRAHGIASQCMFDATGQHAFSPVPTDRWDATPGMIRYGTFIPNLDLFDQQAFRVSTAEVASMDPQQRLLLELSYEAFHGGGLNRRDLFGTNLGVYVGVMSVEFREALEQPNAFAMTGTGHCFAAGRISYALGLHGSCEAFDTACSSSLVACHSARRALQNRDCSNAMLAGVNVLLVPSMLEVYAAAGLTSPSGRSFAFDARADGFVRGESCGAASVQGQLAAQLFVGSCVRQDGKSATLTAPNGTAQQIMFGALFADTSSTAAQLSMMEAAANGSTLGDPIEAGAVAASILGESSRTNVLGVGSVKANIGHTESASGMMGISRLHRIFKQALVPPNAQLLSLSSNVAVALQAARAPATLPVQLAFAHASNLGSASAFGLGGTIASVLLHALSSASNGLLAAFTRRHRSFPWRKPRRVVIMTRGAISNVVLGEQYVFRSAMLPDEIEMQVLAVGLNFKDVLNVLGELPAQFLTSPGDDCAGILTTAGASAGISKRRGDEVFGVATGCLCHFVRARTDSRLVVPRPACITPQQASTLPTVWTTMHEVTRRAKGCKHDRFLLHAAAGGIGMIGVEYLNWLSAPIVASAGQVTKHALLNCVGVTRLCSSRIPEAFAQAAASLLTSARIRTVCNSLSRDFISASCALLSENASIQEICKRGAWSWPHLNAASIAVQLSVVDLVTDLHDVLWGQHAFRNLARRVRSRVTHALPISSFPLASVQAALQLLRSGTSIGKVIVCSSLSTIANIELQRGPTEMHSAPAPALEELDLVDMTHLLAIAESVAGKAVDVDTPLMDAGIDSLGAVELRNQVDSSMGGQLTLPGTLVFDHPTVRMLTQMLQCSASVSRECAAPVAVQHSALNGGATLIGVSSCLPSGESAAETSRLANMTSSSAAHEVPIQRWRIEVRATEMISRRVRHGAFLQGI